MSATATRAVRATACKCCGRPDRLEDVKVIDQHTSRPATLVLCRDCVGKRDATWKLRYKPVKV